MNSEREWTEKDSGQESGQIRSMDRRVDREKLWTGEWIEKKIGHESELRYGVDRRVDREEQWT